MPTREPSENFRTGTAFSTTRSYASASNFHFFPCEMYSACSENNANEKSRKSSYFLLLPCFKLVITDEVTFFQESHTSSLCLLSWNASTVLKYFSKYGVTSILRVRMAWA